MRAEPRFQAREVQPHPSCAHARQSLGHGRVHRFLLKQKGSTREKYRRFDTAAEAICYAVETLRTPKAFSASLQVDDERFNSTEIERLYEADDFPLRKPE